MRTAILLSFTAVTTAAATAHAERNELAFGGSARALRTTSANALTDDGLGGGTLAYARRLDLELLPGLELWPEAAFGWGAAWGTMFQTIETELDTLSFTLGARARYMVWRRHVAATARVDLGTVRAAVALRDANGRGAADHGWGATTSAAAGLELYVIRKPTFGLGVRFELGAVAASPIELTAKPVEDRGDMLSLDTMATSLGSLNLSGPFFATSLVGQF